MHRCACQVSKVLPSEKCFSRTMSEKLRNICYGPWLYLEQKETTFPLVPGLLSRFLHRLPQARRGRTANWPLDVQGVE